MGNSWNLKKTKGVLKISWVYTSHIWYFFPPIQTLQKCQMSAWETTVLRQATNTEVKKRRVIRNIFPFHPKQKVNSLN